MTAPPEVQAMLALCAHPAYLDGCAACAMRQAACCEHLLVLCEQAIAAFD